MATYTARGRWFLNAAGDGVVAETDPTAATLYCTPEMELDADAAKALGVPAADAAAAQAQPDPDPAPEHKALHAAAVEDKSARRPRG